jgi:C1A family cysteine protease
MKAAFLLPAIAVADVPLTMSWDDWKAHYGMTFNGDEDVTKEKVFGETIAFIESENAKDNTYTLGVNQFSHLTVEEFQAQFTGAKGGSSLGSDDAHLGELEVQSNIAADVDWSTNSAVVNPVKDQGQCGSCWAFSAVGTVESAYAIAAGKLGSYAEQQLVDCSTNGPQGGSQGCNGGFNQYGIAYIGDTGIAAENSYPYTATDGTCRASSVSKELPSGTVAGYQSVGKTNEALMSALNTSPVSVTVNADNTWQSYRSGVLTKNCGLFGQIDHAVIAVGYDSSDSTIKIRNSWGASWGEAGYVRVSTSVTDPYCLYKTAPFVAQISADVTV